MFSALVLSACSNLEADLGDRGGPNAPTAGAWQSIDIGSADLGNSKIRGDQIVVQGVGDIADYEDAFHFTYKEASECTSISAKLVDHGPLQGAYWTKLGLSIRDGLDPAAANVTMYYTDNDYFKGIVVVSRKGQGQNTVLVGNRSGVSTPLWMRLRCAGDSIVAEYAPDGQSWSEVTTATGMQLTGDVFLGLAVASGNLDSPIDGTFSDVQIAGSTTDPRQPPTPGPTPGPTPVPVPNPDPMPDPNPGPKTSTTYTPDTTTDFLNPERGFHSEVDLIAGTGFDNVRSRGFTLVRSYVRLDDFRNNPNLSDSFLSSLRRGLERLRSSGIKVVIRFSYNFGNAPDAPRDIVLSHIRQLGPVLQEYSDVIAVAQAGFIGAWGEWHSSTNGLATAANKKAIAEALLDVLPTDRMIEVRAPFHRRDIVGSPSPNIDWFDGSYAARIGFVNDCFLSTADDTGTYAGDQVRDRNETADFTRYTVTGGETCAIGYPSPRQDCPVALAELAQFHWDYLNSGFHSGVLNTWRQQGCYDEISRRLGYRLALLNGAVTSVVNPGGVLTLDLQMRNDGFGKVYNPRPIDIVLRNAATGAERTLRVVADARKMLPPAGQAYSMQLSVKVPADMLAGDYQVLLSLPDAAPQLRADARYAIRLANLNMWEADRGLNSLGLTTQVRN